MYILEFGISSISIKLLVNKSIYEYYQLILILQYLHIAVTVMYMYLLTILTPCYSAIWDVVKKFIHIHSQFSLPYQLEVTILKLYPRYSDVYLETKQGSGNLTTEDEKLQNTSHPKPDIQNK